MIITCPHCGNDFEVSASDSSCACPSCGMEVTAEMLISGLHADSENANEPETSVDLAAIDPASEENPVATDPASEEKLEALPLPGDDAATSEASGESASDGTAVLETEERPFLDNWKTGGGMFALGFFASFAIGAAVERFNFSYVLLGISLVYIAFIFVYALWIYPSLFTATPKLKSNRTVSFLNGFCGSLIFGALWNLALNNKEKGFSQYVLIGLNVIGIGLAAVLVFGGVIGGGSGSAALYSHPESYCTTSEARAIASGSKTGSSNDAALSRITFGYTFDNGAGWAPRNGTLTLSRDATVEIVTLAFLQMFRGDPDATSEALIQAWNKANISAYNPNNVPANQFTGRIISSGSFYVDNTRYELMMIYLVTNGEVARYEHVSISRA